jgi:hypothetical protein
MKAALKLIFTHLLLLSFISCNSNTVEPKEKQLSGKIINASAKKTRTNENPLDESIKEKLHGIWQSNHEPAAMQFFEDGSFRRYIPEGAMDPESPEEEFDNGIWKIEDGQLSLKSESGEKQKILISWVEEDLIYLGNIEDEYDSNYGSKKEFAEEMGFSKITE